MFFNENDSKTNARDKDFIYAHNTQTDSVHKYCIFLKECLNVIVIERKR